MSIWYKMLYFSHVFSYIIKNFDTPKNLPHENFDPPKNFDPPLYGGCHNLALIGIDYPAKFERSGVKNNNFGGFYFISYFTKISFFSFIFLNMGLNHSKV